MGGELHEHEVLERSAKLLPAWLREMPGARSASAPRRERRASAWRQVHEGRI